MAGAKMLFACTKCHSRHRFEELSREEQLCKSCRRKYPLVSCTYCRLEFHLLKKVDGDPHCAKCTHNLFVHGEPKNCKYCKIKAAFKLSCCSRCISSEKRYGPPVQCQRCQMQCAFNKNGESKEKVGGELLCLQCTLDYKRNKHRQDKERRYKHDNYSNSFARVSTDSTVIAPLKAENLASASFKSRFEAVERTSRQNSRSNSPFRPVTSQESVSENIIDSSYGDHMSEMTNLRDQIATLKKVISQKEKIILEKDKKINELQAERWGKEKLLRQKIQAIQKESSERVEYLSNENQTLKKQISGLSRTRKSTKANIVSSKIRLEAHKLVTTPSQYRKEVTSSYDTGVESDHTTANQGENNKFANKRDKDEEVEKKTDSVDEDDLITEVEPDDDTNVTTETNTPIDSDEGVESPKNTPMNSDEGVESPKDTPMDSDEGVESPKNIPRDSDEGVESPKNTPRDSDEGVEIPNNTPDNKQISFDEAQAAQIKKLLKADDEYSSSGMDEEELKVRHTKKRKKKRSKMAVEEDVSTGVDEENEINIGPKKKRKKKRHILIDDGDLGENGDQVVEDKPEKNNNMDEKNPTANESEELESDMFVPTDPDNEEDEEKVIEEEHGNDMKPHLSDDEKVERASWESDSDELQVDEDI